MEKQQIINDITKTNIKNYSFIALFFGIFTFFIVFIIRPNINTVISQTDKLQQIKTRNESLDTTIKRLNTIQSILARRQKDFGLLEEALPSKTDPYKIATDLKSVFLTVDPEAVLTFPAFGKSSLNKKTTQAKEYLVTTQGTYKIADILDIVYNLTDERRLKLVKKISSTLKKDSDSSLESTQGANLKKAKPYFDTQVDVAALNL